MGFSMWIGAIPPGEAIEVLLSWLGDGSTPTWLAKLNTRCGID